MLECLGHDNTPRWKEGERLHHLFEERCDALLDAATPCHGGNGTFTYRDLDARANRLARILCDGVKARRPRGAVFDKGVDTYVALLAVLKATPPTCRSMPASPPIASASSCEDAGRKAASFRCRLSREARALPVADDPSRRESDRDRRQPDAPARRTTSRRAGRSARLHHLYLGHDRQAEGRRDRASRDLQFRPRRRRDLRLWAGRPRLSGHDDRLRLLDRGDLGAAHRRRDAGPGHAGATACSARTSPISSSTQRITVLVLRADAARHDREAICRTCACCWSPARPARRISSRAGPAGPHASSTPTARPRRPSPRR